MRRGVLPVLNHLLVCVAAGLLVAFALTADAAAAKKAPDLRVRSVGAPPRQAEAGSRFRLTFAIENRGKRVAKPSSAQAYLSRRARFGRDAVRLGARQRTRRLAPGKRATTRVKVKVPASVRPRTYRVIICADSRKKVRESDERHNCRASRGRIEVIAAPAPGPLTPGPIAPPTFPPVATPGPGPGPTPDPTPTPGPIAPPPIPDPPAPPADPADVAPPADASETTSVAEASAFLYSGDAPIQTGVAPGTIEPVRAGVLRGRVLDRAGAPLTGVEVTVLDHPELGETLTREDGMFDLAVNGGTTLTVTYRREGYFSVQRKERVLWQDYERLDDVVLTPLDASGTRIPLEGGVARASRVVDEDGARQMTMMFEPQTSARMTVRGRARAVDSMTVRATEYTVGERGPEAMPGELPATSAYTYATELSLDEAIDAGASDVTFSKPVSLYLENFLGIPVGQPVPAGYYDREKGKWVGSRDGMVIRILSVEGGIAAVDADGDGVAEDDATLAAGGLDQAERRRLAGLYTAGQELWRVEVNHFTPWDLNWPYGLPPGATPPEAGPFGPEDPDEKCEGAGSIIGCEDQTLAEELKLTGTAYRLRYQSNRVPGRRADYTTKVRLTGKTVPPNAESVVMDVEVGGQRLRQTFPAEPNLVRSFTWDGKDVYGRTLQGEQLARVTVSYVYGAVYFGGSGGGRMFAGGSIGSSSRTDDDDPATAFANSFANVGTSTIEADRSTLKISLSNGFTTSVGSYDARGFGLGGWSLSSHHAYDPTSRKLHLGNGTTRSAAGSPAARILRIEAGTGSPGFGGDGGAGDEAAVASPHGVAIEPDGGVLIADTDNERIRRLRPDGTISTAAGTGEFGYSGDGGPATDARLGSPEDVAVGPDGAVYIADTQSNRIRRIAPDGRIATFAGGGAPADGVGDGGPATEARLRGPRGVAVGPDGMVYIADSSAHRVRQVLPDGTISTPLGTGEPGRAGDGGRGTRAELDFPTGVALGADGAVYVADSRNNRVRRLAPDGVVTTVAGGGATDAGLGDGGPATDARLVRPRKVAVGPDGDLFIADTGQDRIRRVAPDGAITTVAGGGEAATGEGPAAGTRLEAPTAVAVSPDAAIYVTEGDGHRLRSLRSAFAGYLDADIAIPSENGALIYQFNENGRHLRTLDAFTGDVRARFGYDGSGRLTSVEDAHGNVTHIERAADGRPTAVVAPGGQRTTLSVDDAGYLTEVRDPLDRTVAMTYSDGGLLKTLTEPNGAKTVFGYDDAGRLVLDDGPGPGQTTLARTEDDGITEVTATDAMDRKTIFRLEELASGTRSSVISPTGALSTLRVRSDGTRESTSPTGMVTTVTTAPDPRFGMLAPYVAEDRTRTPAGLTTTQTTTRSAVGADPARPLELASQTDTFVRGSRTSRSRFDVGTRTLIETSPSGRETRTVFDAQGNVASFARDGLPVQTREYDARGRLTRTSEGGLESSSTYDAANRVVTRTAPGNLTTHFEYDDADRVVGLKTPGGRQITFAYDANGNATAIGLPGGATHTFAYDNRDLLTSYTAPGAAPLRRSYRPDRSLERSTLPQNRSTAYGLDAGGRPTGLDLPEAVNRIAYASGDPTARAASITRTPAGANPRTQRNAYDYDGDLVTGSRLTGEANGAFNYRYATDTGAVELAGIGLVSGGDESETTFARDDDGLLTTSGPFTLTRGGPAGRVSRTTGDGLDETLDYDALGRVGTRTLSVAGTEVARYEFEYDTAGRLGARTETIDGIEHRFEYAYSADSELAQVKRDGAIVERYAYDTRGNRTSRRIGAAAAETATYDLQDRIQTAGGRAYDVDGDGFLVGRDGDDFTYGTRGELLSATVDGKTVTYAYDGLGRRVSRTQGGETTSYLYGDTDDPSRISAIRSPDSGLTTLRWDETGRLLALERGGERYFVASDQVGTPEVVTTADGTVVKRLEHDAYGVTTSDSDPDFELPIGFAGGLADPVTGLVRFGFRDYEPGTGRWTARDPLLFDGGQYNLYAYAGSNPVNGRDPLGLAFGLPSFGDVISKGVSAAAGAFGLPNVCVGASAYAGVGGGGKVCFGPDGVAACAKVGLGFGGGAEGSAGGDLPDTSVFVEVAAQFGPASATETLSRKIGCANVDFTVDVGLKTGPIGPSCSFGTSPTSCSITASGGEGPPVSGVREGVSLSGSGGACKKWG